MDPKQRSKLQLPTALPLPSALLSAFDGLLGYALEMPLRARHEPERAVHEFRKSVRRLRSLVRLVRDSLGKESYQRIDAILGDAARSVSALRDSAVLLDTLATLPEKKKTAKARRVLEQLFHARSTNAGDPKKAAELLQTCTSKLAPTSRCFRESLYSRFGTADLEDAYGRSVRRCRRALKKSAGGENEDAMHTLRKRVKELRYQLELIRHLDGETVQSLHKATAALAEQLGEVTDLLILSEAIADTDDLPASNTPTKSLDRLARQTQRRTQKRFAVAYDCAAALLAPSPRRFARRVVGAIEKELASIEPHSVESSDSEQDTPESRSVKPADPTGPEGETRAS